jgi:flagellar protein FliL
MAKDDEKEAKDGDAKGGGKGKTILMVLPLVLLLAGAGWYFFLRPAPETGPVELPEPIPGAVVPLDPITINLAGAHFLKLGMSLQPIAGAHEAPSGAKALDLAISQFSGMTIEELSSTKGRSQAKEELVARIKLAYLPHGTDLAVATGSAAAGETSTSETTSSSHDEEEGGEESSSHGSESGELTEESLAELSGEEAVKLAHKLTVQTEVYNVYLTEFVMQ